MNLTRMHAFAPILPLALVALFAPRADAPVFAPKEGTQIKRTIEMKGARDLLSHAAEMGEVRETDTNAFLHVDIDWKHVVLDEYEKCAGDRIERLKRTYESLARGRNEKSKNQKGDESTKEMRETCDLEGKTVTFAWNAEKAAYEKSVDGGADEALLADLELDMDYREFLPEKDAAVGAKWERDYADIKLYLLRPGGDLPFHGEKPVQPMDRRMREAAWNAAKGKVEFELKPATEEDGKKLAHIHFKGTHETDASVDAEADEKGPDQLAMRDEQAFEGELVWELGANRAHALEWKSKGTMVLTISSKVSKEGEELVLKQAFTFDTDYVYTGSFEVQ